MRYLATQRQNVELATRVEELEDNLEEATRKQHRTAVQVSNTSTLSLYADELAQVTEERNELRDEVSELKDKMAELQNEHTKVGWIKSCL